MLSIGTFAGLGHISVRMLRHYDAIGLLTPVHVDPQTGYRYYEWHQLETLGRIGMLKGYQFPLARIRELLTLDDAALDKVLKEKRLVLYQEIAQLQSTVRRLDRHIGQMEEIGMHQEANQQAHKVIVMEAAPQQIFGITRHIHIGQVHELFQDLHAEMAKRGLKKAGAGMMFYLGEEFSYDNMDVEAAFPVAGEHPDTHMMAGGPYVCAMHYGPNETVSQAYEAIGKWLSDHPEYEIAGPSFERYIKDENDGVPPEDFETGVLFPVKKVQ